MGLYDRAIEILERLVNVEGRRELANDLARLYMNKAIAVKNLGDNRAAVALYDRAIEILERLVNVEGRRELANDLAMLYSNKANAGDLATLYMNKAAVKNIGDNRNAVRQIKSIAEEHKRKKEELTEQLTDIPVKRPAG